MNETKTTAFGTTGLVVGIVGIAISFIPIVNNGAFFLGLLAVVFGIITLCKKGSLPKAIIAIVLGVLAVVITLIMQASVSDAIDDAFGDHTDDLLGTSVSVEFGEFYSDDNEYFASTKLPVTVSNLTEEKKSMSVHIEAVDANGTRIEDDTVYVNDLNGGQSQVVDAFTLITSDKIEQLKGAEFKVVEVSVY